jgi:hypothetical protein
MQSIVDGNLKDTSLVLLGIASLIIIVFTVAALIGSFIIIPAFMEYILPPLVKALYLYVFGGQLS